MLWRRGPWQAWRQRHALLLDAVLAIHLAAFSVPALWWELDLPLVSYRPPDALGVALTLVGCLALVWRRRHPTQVLAVTLACEVPLTALAYNPGLTGFPVLIAIYTVASCCGRAVSTAALIVVLSTAALHPLTDRPWQVAELIAGVALSLAAWAFGRSVGARRAYVAELELRADRLERAREADLRAGLAEERTRIARELHDVVAHSLSVMTVQASAAQRQLDRAPERSREAMAAVEATGRSALAEMRSIVGVLREPDLARRTPLDPLAPQPGVADLAGLLEQVQDAGLPTKVVVRGEARPLPQGVDLTVFRIVQEALTNTLKHAGPTTGSVELRYEPAALVVRVLDNGRGAAAGLPSAGAERTSQGHGLLGMRERVELYDGRLRAGPRAGGGFEVTARIPLAEVALPPRPAGVPVVDVSPGGQPLRTSA